MRLQLTILSTLGLALLAGCGDIGSYPSTATTGPVIAPTIVTQPASLTVPMGLEGIFKVAVYGNPLNYQWFRNGVAITSANSLSYMTPTVAATDTGTVYTVTISNSAGSVTSQPATLTAGARAPKNGDLRFQQVDSENTVNGYGGSVHIDISPRFGYLFGYSTGSPLSIDSGECVSLPVPPNDTTACGWGFEPYYQPSGTTPIATGYVGDVYSNLQGVLQSGEFPSSSFGGGSLLAPNTVISSISLLPAYGLFGLCWVQTSATGGFDLAQHTVSPAQLQAAATQEGQSSRVITAISYDTGGITYYSYGWTGDTTTVYDVQTATTTFANAGTEASSLAANGYIVTAMGGDPINGIVMVGTKVHGDIMPRQILVIAQNSPNLGQLSTQGYALVGVVTQSTASSVTGFWIGER